MWYVLFFLGKGSGSTVKFSMVFIIKILLRVSSSKFSLTKVIFKKMMELNILSGDVIMYDFTFTTPDKELN